MTKPAMVLVTGSFSLPDHYDMITIPLREKGWEVKALHLQSAGLGPKQGREGAPPTMYDDAAFIRKEIEKLADEGKDVVLFAHSYGGTPATESLKGISKDQREREGKKGGVVRLAYMTSIVLPLGETAGGAMASLPEDYPHRVPIDVDENGWLFQTDLAKSGEVCFSDLPKEEAAEWAKIFTKQSAASFATPVTYLGYKDVPVSYLLCEKDLCLPPFFQQQGIDLIEKESGNKVEVTTIQMGHIPMVKEPQVVIDWMTEVASKV